jgi:hypothetical protein
METPKKASTCRRSKHKQMAIGQHTEVCAASRSDFLISSASISLATQTGGAFFLKLNTFHTTT